MGKSGKSSKSKSLLLDLLLKHVRKRPEMFIGDIREKEGALRRLELLIAGFEIAVQMHAVSDESDFLYSFAGYLRVTHQWDLTGGAISTILRMTATPEDAWRVFWREVRAYRKHVGR